MRYFLFFITLFFTSQTFAETCIQLSQRVGAVFHHQVALSNSSDAMCYAIPKGKSDPVYIGTASASVESKCKVSQELVGITAMPSTPSICYQGCVHIPAPNSGCVSVDFDKADLDKNGLYPDGSKPGTATCGFTRTAQSCDAKDGAYSSYDKSKDSKDGTSSTDKNTDAKDGTSSADKDNSDYCKTRTYNSSDPYFTKCANTDKNGNPNDSKDEPSSNIGGIPDTRPDVGGSSEPASSNNKDGTSDNKDQNKDGDDGKDDNVDLSPLNGELPTEDLSSQMMSKLNFNMFKLSGTCPSHSYTIPLLHTSKTFVIDFKKLCDVLEIMGYIIAIAGCLHACEILVRDI